jgi:hypothetical protein
MAVQRESVRVVNPFTNLLHSKGWHTENLHGSQFQFGLPDQLAFRRGRAIGIEYKVIEESGRIKYTDHQLAKFPKLMSCGFPIYIIASKDLSGTDRQTVKEINWLYNHIINGNEPNGMKLFTPELWSSLNPFAQTNKRRGR